MNLAKHFVQKWKFGKMEIWNVFFYKTSRNGIPFHRESTVHVQLELIDPPSDKIRSKTRGGQSEADRIGDFGPFSERFPLTNRHLGTPK